MVVLDKIEEANATIEKCKMENGFHASIQSYPEFWMRDFVFSEEALLRLGYADTVRRQFEKFLRKQRPNGQIPTLITSPWRAIFNQSFHFWTSDGELLFLIGARRYSEATGDSDFLEKNAPRFERCLSFVRGRLNRLGFIPGMDWRDAMIHYRGKCLLANQILLVGMYQSLRMDREARELREKINGVFLSPEQKFYADCVWWEGEDLKKDFLHFDCFGNSLAILDGVAPDSAAKEIAGLFAGARSEFGYRNIFPPLETERYASVQSIPNINAFVRTGAIFRNAPHTYQNSTIWPFVEARVIHALVKLGFSEEAARIYNVALHRKGVNEWYDPLTGEPRGSKGQLWTAASILEAKEALSS